MHKKSNEQKGVQLITGSLRLHSVFLEYSASLMFGSDSVHCRFAVQIAIQDEVERDLQELQREDHK